MNGVLPLTAEEILQIGHYFQIEGCLFQITSWDPQHPLHVAARALESGEIQDFSLTDLFAPERQTQFAPTPAALAAHATAAASLPVADAASLPAALLQRATTIIQTVETVQAEVERTQQRWHTSATAGSLTAATRTACQALPQPLSLTQYYAYRQLYRTYGADRAQIAAALHRSTYQKTRIDPNAQHFVDTLIRRFYRSNPPLRAHTVYQIAHQLWQHNRHWWLTSAQASATEHAPLIERLLDGRRPIDDLLADPQLAAQLTPIQLPSRSWFYSYLSWFRAQPGT